jgi:hypothetical protein
LLKVLLQFFCLLGQKEGWVDKDDYQIEIHLLKDEQVDVASVSVLILSKYIPNTLSKEGVLAFTYQSINQ